MSDADSERLLSTNAKVSVSSLLDPSRKREPPEGFQCGEFLDHSDSTTNVMFFCTIPVRSESFGTEHSCRLTFCCRDRSVGVLEQKEEKLTTEDIEENQEEEVNVDPNFFDSGYTLAGRTGFQVWAGTRILLEALLYSSPGDCSRLETIQKELWSSNKKILELGAGVGVVSTSLAAALSAQILSTDLPTLVEHSIVPNLRRNENQTRKSALRNVDRKVETMILPEWLCSASRNQLFEEEDFGDEPPVFPIGDAGGWVSIASVDWTKPLSERVASIANEVDWIIASDCVWLVSMLDSLLDTVDRIFQKNTQARLILSFQRRDAADSSRFTRIDSIVDAARARGWGVECLAWRYTHVDGDTETKEVMVVEIWP
ncbi:MAG: hypothetical protein SGILL_000125 [Bacillariaceae sp.]